MNKKESNSSISRLIPGVFFLLPGLVCFAALVLIPILQTIRLSFIDWDILTPAKWAGIQNFAGLIKDRLFWKYVGNTFFLGLWKIIPFFLVPILITLLARKISKKGQIVLALLYAIPLALLISPLSIYMAWRWIFNPDFGLLNSFLAKFGVDGPQWLSSTAWAKPAYIIMAVVQFTPAWTAFGLILYLAAWRGSSFRTAVIFMLILLVVSSLGGFAPQYVLTGGGPAGATTNVMFYSYRNAYQWFKMGYASAILVPVILFLFLLGVVLWRITEKRELKIVFLEREKETKNIEPESSLFLLLIPLTFIIILLAVIPLIWAFLTSIKEPGDVFSYPVRLIPSSPFWKNYVDAWRAIPFGRLYINTILRTAAICIPQVIIAFLAAYSLSVLKVPGRRVLFFLFAATMFLSSGTHLRIPIFIWLRLIPERLNLIFDTNFWWSDLYIGKTYIGRPVGIDSYFGLIVPGLACGWAVFLFKIFLDGLVSTLDDEREKGVSEWEIFWRRALPKASPVIGLVLVACFFFTWREFGWPLLVTNSMEMKTLAIGVASLQGLYSTEWTLLMAGALIALIPPMIAFLILVWLFHIFIFPRLSITTVKEKPET